MYRIKNWSRYQKHKIRNPTFIFDHVDQGEDEQIKQLSALARNLLTELRRMAARLSSDGSIPLTQIEIRRELRKLYPKRSWWRTFHFHELEDAGFLILELSPPKKQDPAMPKKLTDEEMFTSEFEELWDAFPPPEGANLGKKRRAAAVFYVLSSEEKDQVQRHLSGPSYQNDGLLQCLNASHWREGEAPAAKQETSRVVRPPPSHPPLDPAAPTTAPAPKPAPPVEITDELRAAGAELSNSWPENDLYPKQPDRDIAAFATVASNIGISQAKYCAEKFLRMLKKRPKEFRKVTLMRNFFARDEWRAYLQGFSEGAPISSSTTAQSDDPFGLPPPSPMLAFIRPNHKPEGNT